jgi:hypothetical protein
MAPTDNTLSVTPDSALDVATYYGTCNGTNPFDESLTAAYIAVDDLNASITFLVQPGGLCENNPYLLACYPAIDDIYANLTSISADIACEPIQDEWDTVFNKAVCSDYFLAVYLLVQIIIGIFLTYFPLLIVSSLLYQYFDSLWNTDEGHTLEIPIRDAEGSNPLGGSMAGISMAEAEVAFDPTATYSTLVYEDTSSSKTLPPPPPPAPLIAYSISKDENNHLY